MIADEVDSWRRRISQKVEDIQGLIESSKFEFGDLQVDAIQKCTGEGQLIIVLLLSLARESRDTARLPDAMWGTAVELDKFMATALEELANRVSGTSVGTMSELGDSLNALERTLDGMDARNEAAAARFTGRLALYRTLVATIKRLSSGLLVSEQDEQHSFSSNEGAFFANRQTRLY